MLDYATDLKSMTQGRGWFVLSHARYEPAPNDVAQKVIAAAKAEQRTVLPAHVGKEQLAGSLDGDSLVPQAERFER